MSALPPKVDIADYTGESGHLLALSAWPPLWRGHNCDTRPDGKISYNRGMNENLSRELLAWLTQAGLAGTPESDIFSVFCARCVAAGIPLGRAHVAIDTLHP